MPEEALDEVLAEPVDEGEYIPNTEPPTVRGGHRDGQAVVSGPFGSRPAPKCLLYFECPECKVVTEGDAYKGVVACGICTSRPFMKPIGIA